ncbi:Tetratricopeptide repeat-domain-containing protein [Podospora appendiculata]|uniref:Tetratricopeptide repeat-domain-containing protein n=1 Tax=Podospora appendiculata TaxID=314037 RepID=A0AAE1CEB7_9PEZI|nr:Tetratricopeptide repeat-domain-containing protein [Podospora appendiculata]
MVFIKFSAYNYHSFPLRCGSEKVLGLEHPDTLTSMNNLAFVWKDQGKFEEAEQMNRRALGGREKVLGLEHPDTLTSVSNLASVLQDQGKYEEAEQMNRRALVCIVVVHGSVGCSAAPS